MEQFVEVAALTDLPAGTQRSTRIGPLRVLLCHARETGAIHAIENQCPHALQPLEGGELRHGAIQCPKHGARFDLASGFPLNSVTNRPVRIFAVKVEDDRIFVALQSGTCGPS